MFANGGIGTLLKCPPYQFTWGLQVGVVRWGQGFFSSSLHMYLGEGECIPLRAFCRCMDTLPTKIRVLRFCTRYSNDGSTGVPTSSTTLEIIAQGHSALFSGDRQKCSGTSGELIEVENILDRHRILRQTPRQRPHNKTFHSIMDTYYGITAEILM